MEYDAIIIGAGLGGLTAGAKLAKEGKRVLLIEQHNIVGGCATTIKRKDFKIDVGFHKIDGLGKSDTKTKIFEELGVFKKIDFIKIPEFYNFINRNTNIVIPFNYKEAIEILISKFPEEKKGINKFYKIIMSIQKEVRFIPDKFWKVVCLFPLLAVLCPNLLFYHKKTTGVFIDSIIKDENLKMILLANIIYYHDNPHTLSLLFYSLAQASFFSGAYYIKGGSQNLSDHLAGIIRNNSGTILLNHIVTRIITKNEKAVGVIYNKKKGTRKVIAHAKNIIANVSVPSAINKLLSIKNMARFKQKIKDQEISCSLFSIYLGFKRPLIQIGNKNYSTFISHEKIENLSDVIKNHRSKNYNEKNFVFVDYSQIDSNLSAEDKSMGVINTIDYYDNWKNLDRNEYREKKEKIARILINRLDKIIPGLKDIIEFYEVSTPKTIHRYTLNPEGSPYGFAQTPEQAGLNRIGIISPIKKLFFASAWTMPGGGFTGAILSGYACAKNILK